MNVEHELAELAQRRAAFRLGFYLGVAFSMVVVLIGLFIALVGGA